jgi:hypothetical protein
MLPTLQYEDGLAHRSLSLSKGPDVTSGRFDWLSDRVGAALDVASRRFNKLSDRGDRMRDCHGSSGCTIRIPSMLAKLYGTTAADRRHRLS